MRIKIITVSILIMLCEGIFSFAKPATGVSCDNRPTDTEIAATLTAILTDQYKAQGQVMVLGVTPGCAASVTYESTIKIPGFGGGSSASGTAQLNHTDNGKWFVILPGISPREVSLPSAATEQNQYTPGETADVILPNGLTATCTPGWAIAGVTLAQLGVTNSGGGISPAVRKVTILCRGVRELGTDTITAQTADLDGPSGLTATCAPGWAATGVSLARLGVRDSGANNSYGVRAVTLSCRKAPRLEDDIITGQTADVNGPSGYTATCAPGWVAAGVRLGQLGVTDSRGTISPALRAVTILCRHLTN
jgi:hypothetical protein